MGWPAILILLVIVINPQGILYGIPLHNNFAIHGMANACADM